MCTISVIQQRDGPTNKQRDEHKKPAEYANSPSGLNLACDSGPVGGRERWEERGGRLERGMEGKRGDGERKRGGKEEDGAVAT